MDADDTDAFLEDFSGNYNNLCTVCEHINFKGSVVLIAKSFANL